MQQTASFQTRNLLLGALSEADAELLRPDLVRVELIYQQVLAVPGDRIEKVYFPESGVASVVSQMLETAPTEIGIFGREGMSGVPGILGADTVSTKTFMQIPGATALCIGLAELKAAMEASAGIRSCLLKFVQTALTQVSHTAVSNARHPLEARLARWLLMCHDRVDGDEMELTHEFMAAMIGAQRSGVTVTLHILEGGGSIRSHRGRVVVRDRGKLEELAGDAYGLPEAEYRRLIAPFGRSAT